MKSLQKVIWAADPLEDQPTQDQSLGLLRDLAKRSEAAIEPVYVLSGGLLNLSIPRDKLEKEFKLAAEGALSQLVKRGRISRFERPTVLVASSATAGGAAESLDRYSRSKKADLIFVNSHGRQGIRRVLMGSFSETLMLHSKTPILISGPRVKHISKLDHILFPTDFSRKSKKTFERVQALARKLDAKVTVFHAVVDPIEPFVQSGAALLSGGVVWTRGLVERVYEDQKKAAAIWKAEARRRGLQVDVVFDVDSNSAVLSILRYASRKKPGMIAMASASSAASAAFLGSIGRGVAREAPCPVWFFRA